MTTPITTSSTDSQMHNNIMAAGSKERPPMLATGRYAQWRSQFLCYLDTKPNGDALRKCVLEGPYKPSTIVVPAVATTDDSPKILEHTAFETILNMTPARKAHFEAEKDAIFMLLTGIRDEIYSTVDACQTANEMWTAIERLQQGESLNIQDVKTNIFWEFRKFTSRDGESMESYYSHFYKIMNEMIRNNLKVDTILFDILKQYQNEVNEIRAERIAKTANPLALVASAQTYSDNYHQAPKPERAYAPAPKHASTRHKGKRGRQTTQKDKEMQKNLALIAKYVKKLYKPTNNNLRTSSNSRNKTANTSPRYKNDNQSGQFENPRTMTVDRARETIGTKRVKDYTYHKEKMLLCKQAEQGVPLQAEQADWLADTDEEVDEQELEAHYRVTRVWGSLLVVGIVANCTLAKQTKLEKYIAFNDRTVDYDKLQSKLNETLGLLAQKDNDMKEGLKLKAYEISVVKQKHDELVKQSLLTKSQFEGLIKEKKNLLIKLGLTILVIAFVRQLLMILKYCCLFQFVRELKKEMHEDLKYIESLEKEIDELESDKAYFSNMYDLLLQECVSKDVTCSYLHSLSDLDA
ncbi:hypothetical protein Tco_0864219 [Tanacetum coccineum]